MVMHISDGGDLVIEAETYADSYELGRLAAMLSLKSKQHQSGSPNNGITFVSIPLLDAGVDDGDFVDSDVTT